MEKITSAYYRGHLPVAIWPFAQRGPLCGPVNQLTFSDLLAGTRQGALVTPGSSTDRDDVHSFTVPVRDFP